MLFLLKMIYQTIIYKGCNMKNIAVIFGGESCEHDISIITGVQLLSRANLPDYNLIPIYINKEGAWLTGDELFDIDNYNNDFFAVKACTITPTSQMLYFVQKRKLKPFVNIDAAILCLHGGNGEGGGVSGLLAMAKIPYSSCNLIASAVCLDKVAFKYMMKGIGVEVIDGFAIMEEDFILDRERVETKINKIGYPIIIKPAKLGSSIGIEVVYSQDELDKKIKNAFKYDRKVLVEKYVNIKKEINIAVIEDKGELIFSNTEEPISKSSILSFDEKYSNSVDGFEGIKRISPANINDEMRQVIVDTAARIYTSLDLFGIVRFDFILDSDYQLYINEVNTIPGSMANYLFDKNEYSYNKLIEMLVSNAIHRKVKEENYRESYSSDVLNRGMKALEK